MEAEMEGETVAEKTEHEKLDETRRAIEDIAAKILFIKKEGKSKAELREFTTQMSLLFITLRQLNRTILVEEDRIKAETESAKAPVDYTTLQLHNLMYEKNHYLKAIKTCRDFRSKHPDIELVDEEEYFKNAPEDIKGKVLATDAAHDLMMKRLNYELLQRKDLCKLHEKLVKHKRSLLETISIRKKFLSSLPSHLKSLKKATLPVQQQLGILHTKKLKQNNAAELLPPPLYIIYSQFLAHKEAFGEKLEMEITGNVKDAQAFLQQQASIENGMPTNVENIRLEDDILDEEEDVQRRRKRQKKNLPKESGGHRGMLQIHPLKVIVHVCDDEDCQAKPVKLITLRFEYFVKLNAVCVGVEDAEKGSDDNILCNLFPNDTGTELPHQTAKLYAGNSVAFDDKSSSRPYIWAQHIAGMDFLPEVPQQACNEVPKNEEERGAAVSFGLSLYRNQHRVQTVLQRIRTRKKAQMALVEQLNSLVELKWPLLDNENVPWALHTPLCSLQQWLPVMPVGFSFSAVAADRVVSLADHELDRRSVVPWEVESVREDGELPIAQPATVLPDVSGTKDFDGSIDLNCSRNLALISKNLTPPKMVKSLSMGRYEDISDLILDIESDVDEKLSVEPETEIVGLIQKPWVDHALREFLLVLCRKDENGQALKLEAKVKISIEYPLRPPLFNLRVPTDGPLGSFECYNELRYMESEVCRDYFAAVNSSHFYIMFGHFQELALKIFILSHTLQVNLRIFNILSMEHENYVLAHQIRYLAMLFDLYFSSRCDNRKNSSIVDARCQQVDDILARVVRGRDRSRIFPWKGMGYPF